MRTRNGSGRDGRWARAIILVVCAALHVAGFVWLAQPDSVVSMASGRLEVVFISRAPVPPFPQAPARDEGSTRVEPSARVSTQLERPAAGSGRASSRAAAARRPTLSAPPDRHDAGSATSLSDLDPGRLLELARMAARAEVESGPGLQRDPTRRSAAQLPGRTEPYTPEAIRLRDPVSPQKLVAMVGGMLFGGNYDPCPDTRGKLAELAVRNDPRDGEELQQLIDRERRRCRP